jgi:uncharacterized membrane protein (UPF0127 family)
VGALLVAVAACGDDDTALTVGSTAAGTATVTTTTTTTADPVTTTAAAATTDSTSPTTAAAPTTTGVVPVGFGTVAGRVTAADGSTCDVCLWAAATAADQSRGLMGVTDLGGADGMVFQFGSPVITQFWMRDTVMPLSIAFYAEDGSFVSATDMDPCLTGPADACARYAATGPYANAIEVPQGGLESLLMTAGSKLELLQHDCPLSR